MSAPSSNSRLAIAHAMLKSLATPRTRPFLPENKPIAAPLENEPLAEPIGDDAPGPRKDNAGDAVPQPQRGWWRTDRIALPVLLLIAAAVPRFWQIGRESYWYDEVVTVEVARSSQVIATLKTMDASRAPLHPLILHVWISWFGEAEGATRTLSALFGLVTVAVVFAIGRKIGGSSAGCWAMAFAAMSPLLVQYDRETRMYSLLSLLTCLAWWNLLGFRDSASWVRCSLQSVLMALIAYTHPLGLLMIAGLGAGGLADWRRTCLGLGRWVAIHVVTAAMIAPWIGYYFDHSPEFLSARPTLRVLTGMPIGFTGGDSRSLIAFAFLVALALAPWRIPGLADRPPVGSWSMAWWLALPPAILFAYSLVRDPLFGPARYNVYCAPAFLVLVGCGISRLRPFTAALAGCLLIVLASLQSVRTTIQAEGKADWRAAGAWLESNAPDSLVIVVPPVSGPNRELTVARYYLGNRASGLPADGPASEKEFRELPLGRTFYSTSLRDGLPMGFLPVKARVENVEIISEGNREVSHSTYNHDFRGLRLTEISRQSPPPTILYRGQSCIVPW